MHLCVYVCAHERVTRVGLHTVGGDCSSVLVKPLSSHPELESAGQAGRGRQSRGSKSQLELLGLGSVVSSASCVGCGPDGSSCCQQTSSSGPVPVAAELCLGTACLALYRQGIWKRRFSLPKHMDCKATVLLLWGLSRTQCVKNVSLGPGRQLLF